MAVEKSLGPYRQCSAMLCLTIPLRRALCPEHCAAIEQLTPRRHRRQGRSDMAIATNLTRSVDAARISGTLGQQRDAHRGWDFSP